MNLRRRSNVSSEFEENVQNFAKYCLHFGDMFFFVGIYSNNFIHSDVQLKLLKGELSIQISECTTLQKSIIMKFWRSKGKFTFDGNTLFQNGKKLILL